MVAAIEHPRERMLFGASVGDVEIDPIADRTRLSPRRRGGSTENLAGTYCAEKINRPGEEVSSEMCVTRSQTMDK